MKAICISIALALLTTACGSSTPSAITSSASSSTGRTFLIKPGANATSDMVAAMVQAAPGDLIQFDCGFFDLSQSFQLINTEDVRVKGCGKDQTVLSFRSADAAQGILAVNVNGVTIEDLTVLDSGGNGVELRGVNHGTIRRVRALWSSGGGRAAADPVTAQNYQENSYRRINIPCTDPPTRNPNSPENILLGDTTSPDYTMNPNTGRYGIYPVLSRNILIEESEAVGASDAGIYVGQSNIVIFRHNRAAYNPFGYEIENDRESEYDSNLAECNTGGFLVYDLDGLTQYGDRSLVHGNIVRMNNSYNVAEHPGLVKEVPPGTGFITLGYDRIDIFDNEFTDNNTVGILEFAYALFGKSSQPTDKRLDGYSEGVHIFHNKFANNGASPPIPSTTDLANQDILRAFPMLIGLKGMAACLNPLNTAECVAAGDVGFKGAHLLFDGNLDAYRPDCPYPTDADGNPVPKDERGRPLQGNQYPNPECTYNAYKFDTTQAAAPKIVPDWFASCIDADNTFSGTGIRYANFHGTKGLEALVDSNIDPSDPVGSALSILTSLDPVALTEFAADFDMTPHDCVGQYGRNLARLAPVEFEPFVRSGDYDPGPSAEEVAKLCGAAIPEGQANFGAAKIDCPTLDQYHLFANPEDPTSAPNGGGVPFVLNTKLFSDYAVKYRVAYVPPGTHAIYNDKASNGVDATAVFPVGTIIAKTFSFPDESAGTEIPMETRLLIKRVTSKGHEHWDGAAYIWSTNDKGKRVANLALGGATAPASWDYADIDSNAHHVGSTQGYLIPNRAQCLTCHSAENKDPGAAPIGPKIRFLNRPYQSESREATEQSRHEVHGRNQIQYWCEKGLMTGCPGDLGVDPLTQIATKLERVPVFNKPGDSGFAANSPQDIESRARAYLEVNCQHCHNPHGFAANTGFYLDSFRAVDGSYGICKQPTAAGAEGTGGRTYDIEPAASAKSILEFRIGPNATTPAARMPPLARSVVHDEGHALIQQWIDQVITADENKYPGSTSCAGQ
ncbi:MAG TPA: parallel beta-helix domain-containing protein [Nevskiaceae bacterium]|nr:parallel beta-helix domain-containing protein [Nevskiaceae bacterium]